MDKITKQMILLTINEMELDDLVSWLRTDVINIQEMTNAGLERKTINAIQEVIEDKPPLTEEEKQDESAAIYQAIEDDEFSIEKIKDLYNSGDITMEGLAAHTSMTAEEIDILDKWPGKGESINPDPDSLPPLLNNRTDIFFFGVPGSGKSCVLSSLMYYMDEIGVIADNTYNLIGTQYRNQLKDDYSKRVLPDGTAVEAIHYMPFDLRNLSDKSQKHPLNFVDMSGELFRDAYEKGINSIHPKVVEYLKHKNRKVIFLIIDYNVHLRPELEVGPSQSSMLTAGLQMLDDFGTLKKVDAINVLVTKSDLFPDDCDKTEYASEFMNTKYRNFVENLREKMNEYAGKNSFEATIYPYSIGKVKFKGLLVEQDLTSAENITMALQQDTFVGKRKKGLFK